MCGIAGWYRRKARAVEISTVQGQCDAIRHRGPDDSGVVVDGDFGFGARRLSIVDVTGGHQPITTPDGRYTIAMNGEIYNHQRLRPELIAAGYRFASQCDTETVLAAFATWGEEAWRRLEGMFAVGIWDRRRRELTLARDPLGIKPLYLTEQKGGLAFASELKALLVLPDHRFDVNARAVHDFFSFGHVRQPRSIYSQVRTLEPGHFLVCGSEGEPVCQAFWRPSFRPDTHLDEAQWVEAARDMIRQTVSDHMLSDVPVGSFLSGGIDSSIITSAMAQAGGGGFKAFTVGYPGARIDETAAAAETARHIGCEHIVQPIAVAEAADVLPSVQRCYDEPFGDMAAVPTWQLSKTAARSLKVVLCGEGGDELFAGYKRHRNAYNIERFRPLIEAGRPLSAALEKMPVSRSTRLNRLRQHAQRFTEFVQLSDGYPQFFAATQISSSGLRHRLYSRDFLEATGDDEAYFERLEAEYFGAPSAPRGDALEQFLFADLSLNMPSAMLTRLDRASMAHSLEARVPFLSHRFVDWALTVPMRMKMRDGVGKYILREAARPWLPRSTFTRPKQGFQMPLGAWFRGGLASFAQEAWRDSGAREAGYLDAEAVDGLFREHRAGQADHGRMLYAITMFACWWQDHAAAAAPALLHARPKTPVHAEQQA